jgi:nucleoside-diphosphate-sugar epimerase
LRVGFLGFDFKNKAATIWDDGNHRFPITNVTDIAEALVTLFTDSAAREKAKNRVVWISTVQTSQNDILAAAEKATGEKWKVKNVNGKQQVAEGFEKVSKGDRRGAAPIILSIAFLDGGWRDWSAKAEEGKRILLPNGTGTLEATVRGVVQG